MKPLPFYLSVSEYMDKKFPQVRISSRLAYDQDFYYQPSEYLDLISCEFFLLDK